MRYVFRLTCTGFFWLNFARKQGSSITVIKQLTWQGHILGQSDCPGQSQWRLSCWPACWCNGWPDSPEWWTRSASGSWLQGRWAAGHALLRWWSVGWTLQAAGSGIMVHLYQYFIHQTNFLGVHSRSIPYRTPYQDISHGKLPVLVAMISRLSELSLQPLTSNVGDTSHH